MTRAVLAGLAAMLVVAPAAAEEPWRPADYGLKGQLIFKTFTYFSETATDTQKVVDEGTLQVEWARRWGAWGSSKLVVETRGDDVGFTRGLTFQIPETALRRSYLGVKESTLAVRGGPLEITLGKQILAWGTADAYNPTDRINPYDYLDPFDNEKMGVWAAAARLTVGPTSLVFVTVPFFTPSRLPLLRSRWTPEAPPGFTAVVDHPVRPDQDASATQYAARLRATVAGWDISASYYDGFDHVPAFRQSVFQLSSGVFVPRLTPVYTREKVAGLDFSTTAGKFEIHSEGVFRFVESNGRDDRFQGIAGFNYTQDVGLRWLDQVVIVLEYARSTVLRHIRHSGIIDNQNAPLIGALLADEPFRDAVVGRVQVKLTEDTVLKLSGIADLSGPPSHYIQFKATQRITDAFHVEAGLDFMTGNRDTFFGRWGDNDRFFLMLRYLF